MGRWKDLTEEEKPKPPRRRAQRRALQKIIRKFQTDSEELDGYYTDEYEELIEYEGE